MSYLPKEVREWQEEWKKTYAREKPREDASTNEGLKALLTINGGGIISMLGFMQALVGKSENVLSGFKYYGCTAMLFFGIGLGCAAMIPVFRVLDVNNTLWGKQGHPWWEYALYVTWGISIVAFVVGATFVGQGIQKALN